MSTSKRKKGPTDARPIIPRGLFFRTKAALTSQPKGSYTPGSGPQKESKRLHG